MQQLTLSDRRGCDVCRSPRRRVLHEQRFVTFDGDAGLLAGYDVVVCRDCGFVYADGLPDQPVFERYYREMSKHEPESDVSLLPAHYRRHNTELVSLQVANRLPNRAARILDVGIGTGETLLALRNLGYEDLTGLDPSPRAANIVGREHLLRVLNQPISQMASCEERFDVILMSGVLEHLRDLRPTLAMLKKLLRRNGSMCIAVPDARRFAECVESPFQYLSVEHINFFTLKSLESLFAALGMKLRSTWESTALLGVFKEPIVQAIFEVDASESELIRKLGIIDTLGESQMARYVATSKHLQDTLTDKIDLLIATGQGVVVWGVGSLTMNMLSNQTFSQLNIVAFVDANPNYWDKSIRGVRIIAPASVEMFDETILVVSYAYQDEICSQIRGRYGLKNPVLTLFDVNRIETAVETADLRYG